MDYYSLLGVRRDATQDEIKAAFRAKALQCHPDRLAEASAKQREAAGTHFKAVSEAYNVLRDEGRRAVYNLHGRSATQEYARSQYGASTSGRPYYQQQGYYYHGDNNNAYRPPPSGFVNFMSAVRRGFTRADAIFHAMIAGTLVFGVVFVNQGITRFWERHNTGRSFEEVMQKQSLRPAATEAPMQNPRSLQKGDPP
eukprot:jgi/Chlat1/5592/Chrsp369S00859